ncbi:MAG: hypothetical protein JWR23_860 [Mucilaginibacter sp.]|nr:hypothetical protein [Mucilaginibacter sp.]
MTFDMASLKILCHLFCIETLCFGEVGRGKKTEKVMPANN